MKILLTVGVYPPEIAGPATYVSLFAEWLNKKGFKVGVLTVSKQKYLEASFKIFIAKRIGLFWHIKYFFMLLKIVEEYDVVYINGMFFESFLASFIKRKKYFIRVAGDQIWEKWKNKEWNDLNIDEFQQFRGSLKVRILRKIRRKYLKNAKKIIAPSDYLRKLIEGWGVDENKIKVIFNPYLDVKPEKINYIRRNKEIFTVVTGGRLVNWKGVDNVIKACNMINDVKLIIVGDGPERERLENLAMKLNIKNRVIFTGIISRGQLKTVFEESDCFVLNSQYEGLPHIVLESMHSNCPVAVSRAGGNIEVVNHKETGLLFNVNGVNEIEKSIKIFQENKELTKEIIKNAKTRIEKKFNRDIQFEKTIKAISDF